MNSIFKAFLVAEDGAAAAEYALILAIVAAGIATAMGTLGNKITNAIDTAGNRIDSSTTN